MLNSFIFIRPELAPTRGRKGRIQGNKTPIFQLWRPEKLKFPHFKHKSLRGSFTGKISSPSRRMSKMSYMSYIMDTEEHRYIMQCEMCSPVVVGGSCSDLCADNLISPHQSSSCTWTFPPPARPIPAPRCTIQHLAIPAPGQALIMNNTVKIGLTVK